VVTNYNDYHLILWLKEVSLKVSLFAWRLLHNRITTKDNLPRPHVLTINDHLCTGRCGCIEDTYHLFVSCVFYDNLWYLIYDWFEFSLATSSNLLLHLRHFFDLGGVSSKLNLTLKIIWLATAYFIFLKKQK